MSDDEYQEFEYDPTQYGFSASNDAFNSAELQRSIAERESERQKAEYRERTRKTITAEEIAFCRANHTVFVVIPTTQGFDRFFVSRSMFPSSYFFNDLRYYYEPVVDEIYNKNTAYMCLPDEKGKFHEKIPVEEALMIIYPNNEVRRGLERKERDMRRRIRNASGQADPELDILDKQADQMDALLNKEDETNKCVFCKKSDAQLRCMRMRCAGLFCEVCYNRKKFDKGSSACCPICKRDF